MDEVRLRRFVNDRYGNFPGTVQDEIVGVFRGFLECIRSNPGGHLVIRTERDTSRTIEGIPGSSVRRNSFSGANSHGLSVRS